MLALALPESCGVAAAAHSHETVLCEKSHTEPPSLLLHILGPSKGPQVDKPNPAVIAQSWLVVAGCTGKGIAEVVWNGPCVTNGYNWQLSQNVLYWDDIQNRLSAVEFIYRDLWLTWQSNNLCRYLLHSQGVAVDLLVQNRLVG